MILVRVEAAKNIRSVTANKYRLIIAALLSGVLYGLSFPSFKLSFFAWIALVPVVVCVGSNNRQNFLLGWFSGFLAHLFVFAWIWKTFLSAHVAVIVALGCWLALAALVGVYQGIFLWLYGLVRLRVWASVSAAFAWVILEIIRTYILTGFPWALLGHTRAYDIHLIQIAHWTGVEGLSFLIVFVNVAGAHALLRQQRYRYELFAAAGLVLATYAVGVAELSKSKTQSGLLPVHIAILQGNINQYQKWDDQYESSIRATYEHLLAQASVGKPDVIIWPESSVPGWFPNQDTYRVWVSSLAKASNTYNVVGAVTLRDNRSYNAAFLLSPNGRVLAEYDKQHLVPFGEYIPFGRIFTHWIPYLGELGTFGAGYEPAIFNAGGLRLSPNICYEAIFPALIKRSVAAGTDVIVNITNDGWFLDTSAPEQHYVINIFRAVENRTPVIRAANTGISAVIDGYGREILRTPLLKTGVFATTVMLIPKRKG